LYAKNWMPNQARHDNPYQPFSFDVFVKFNLNFVIDARRRW